MLDISKISLQYECSLILRSFHCSAFDHLQYAKTEGEGLFLFFNVDDVSVYFSRQRGGGVPYRKKYFMQASFISNKVRYIFHKCSKLQSLGQKLQGLKLVHSTPPTFCLPMNTDVIHMIKWPQPRRPSPPFLHEAIKN